MTDSNTTMVKEREQLLAAAVGIEGALQQLAACRQRHADAYQVVSREAYHGTAVNRQTEIEHMIGLAQIDTLIAGRLSALGLAGVLGPGRQTADVGPEWIETLKKRIDAVTA